MHLEVEYMDFLQNMEFVVVQTYKRNQDLRDTDVIKAYDRLLKYYLRKKKHLPGMEVTLGGNAGEVLDAVHAICEMRRQKEPGEEAGMKGLDGLGNDVPITIVVRCLEKLLKSAERWHKKDGQRGYLNFVSKFIV